MVIGIVGLGDMGMLYARIFDKASFKVLGCDLPQNYERLLSETSETNIQVLKEGQEVASQADFLLFCVETEHIGDVVEALAPFIKDDAIVAGQTSIKTPEIKAFEQYLSAQVNIATIHALHGPHVSTKGQTLIAIQHRCSDEKFAQLLEVLNYTGSNIEILDSTQQHDKMMADVQVVTHIGFESIGTSFMHRGVYPWINPLHASGLDNLKMLMTLRIFSYKHHVYAGMALMNPYGKNHVRAYAKAENELFGLMISEDEQAFRKLIYDSKEKVFKDYGGHLMFNDALLKEYALNDSEEHLPNSHLSLLAMVVTWAYLGTNPYNNMVCQTPPFKLRVGMSEYLFMNESLLEESIHAALYDKTIRKDDLAFHTSVQEWAHIVEVGDKNGYESHFERTKAFLSDKLEEGRNKSSRLIERLNNG
ncbi:MAG: prephenate dehydrogenase (NADP+) [Arcticibacterium sp.]|jgi:prephenate dehydrogenase (NADP+)